METVKSVKCNDLAGLKACTKAGTDVVDVSLLSRVSSTELSRTQDRRFPTIVRAPFPGSP